MPDIHYDVDFVDQAMCGASDPAPMVFTGNIKLVSCPECKRLIMQVLVDVKEGLSNGN